MADGTERPVEKCEPRIRVCRNGPYTVTGSVPVAKQEIVCDDEGTPVRWAKGEPYPLKETCTLCRCGHSADKPYCDGTHDKVHFDGTETAGKEEYLEHPDRTEGPELVLWDIEKVCAVARFCHRSTDAWNLTEHSDDPKCKQTAIEEARDCPSGRIIAVDRKTGAAYEPVFERSIGIVVGPQKDVLGPIWVRGAIPVECSDGTTYKVRNRVTLCRCGRSKNKPFCDGSHRDRSEPMP